MRPYAQGLRKQFRNFNITDCGLALVTIGCDCLSLFLQSTLGWVLVFHTPQVLPVAAAGGQQAGV
jgi:hypothetical protein